MVADAGYVSGCGDFAAGEGGLSGDFVSGEMCRESRKSFDAKCAEVAEVRRVRQGESYGDG